MVQKVGLFYFSGTGNTELIAELYKADMESQGVKVDLIRIEEVWKTKTEVDISQYSIVGVGYVIHAFNAPRIVYDFIELLPNIKGKNTFLFKVSGDAFMNGGSTSMIRKRLVRRGYQVFHESLIVMPSNVAIRWGDDVVQRLYSIAQKMTKTSAEEILTGTKKLQANGIFSDISTWLFSRGESVGARFFGRLHLKASKACTRCGKCVRECPMQNISEKNSKIKFRFNCIMCMRCIYGCPVGAITPVGFSWAVIKGYRRTKDILVEKNPKNVFLGEKSRKFFTAAMKKYLGSK